MKLCLTILRLSRLIPMKTNSLIRKGYLNDLFNINRIERDVFKKEAWSINMIKNELYDEVGKSTWVINMEGIIRGYYMIRNHDKECHLINIAIEKSYQGIGLGKILMQHLLDKYSINSSIFLEVKQSNLAAINMYIKMGFKEIYRRKKYYKDGSTALIMNFNYNNNYGMV